MPDQNILQEFKDFSKKLSLLLGKSSMDEGEGQWQQKKTSQISKKRQGRCNWADRPHSSELMISNQVSNLLSICKEKQIPSIAGITVEENSTSSESSSSSDCECGSLSSNLSSPTISEGSSESEDELTSSSGEDFYSSSEESDYFPAIQMANSTGEDEPVVDDLAFVCHWFRVSDWIGVKSIE